MEREIVLTQGRVKRILGFILLIAFILRLAVPSLAFLSNRDLEVFHGADTLSYMEPATKLLTSRKFYFEGIPEITRTPGYPLLLIPGIFLGKPELVTIALQIFLSCATVFLVYKIALLLYGRSEVALASAFLYAIEPLSIIYTSKILTETAFAFAFTAFLYYFFLYLHERKLKQIILAALTLVASAYIRPISYYLPYFFTAFLLVWIFAKVRTQQKTLLAHACVFLIVSMSLLGLWQVRNRAVAGFNGFSAITAINLYYWQIPAVQSVKEGISYDNAQLRLFQKDDRLSCVTIIPSDRKHPCDQNAMYAAMNREGARVLSENALTYTIIHLKGIFRVIFGTAAREALLLFKYDTYVGLDGLYFFDNIFGTLRGIARVNFLAFGLYVVLFALVCVYLALSAIALASRQNFKNISVLLLFTIATYFIVVSGSVGNGRYRHPVMPIVCILAGYGCFTIVDYLKDRKSNSVKRRTSLPQL